MYQKVKSIIIPYIRQPGSWFNNIKWRMPKTISDLETVFVMGSPRSGTTLIQKVIEGHDQYFSIQGETGIFSYQNIFNPERHHFGLTTEQQKELFSASVDIVDFFDKAVKKISIENDGKIFIEKTPQHVIHLDKLVRYFPNAKFVNIVRDGRDCFCSAKHHENIPQRSSVRIFASYWKECVTPPLMLKHNKRLYTFKYESFTKAPEVELNKLMKFLGHELMDKQLDPETYRKDKRASNENFKRLNENINESSVARWKDELGEDEKRVFKEIAGKELSSYGYEV